MIVQFRNKKNPLAKFSGAFRFRNAGQLPPSVPTGLAIAVNGTTLSLSWNQSTEAPVAGYKVYRDGSSLVQVTGTSYADDNLTASHTYSYRVSAVSITGKESDQCSAVSATTSSMGGGGNEGSP